MTTAVCPCLISDQLLKPRANNSYKRSSVHFLFVDSVCLRIRTVNIVHCRSNSFFNICVLYWSLSLRLANMNYAILTYFFKTVLYICHSVLTVTASLILCLICCMLVFVCRKGCHAVQPELYHTILRTCLRCLMLFIYTPVCCAALL